MEFEKKPETSYLVRDEAEKVSRDKGIPPERFSEFAKSGWKDIITKFGGKDLNVDDWGKKRLAYEIQKMKEGYYYFIQFDAESTTPVEIEQRVRIMENVLRFLCVRRDEE